MFMVNIDPLARARLSLEGLSIGDALGGIVVLASGESTLPAEWKEHREELPNWALVDD